LRLSGKRLFQSKELFAVIANKLGALGVLCVSFVFFVSRSPAADPPGIVVDKEKKTITIDAKMAPRKLDYLDQIYPIEVVACFAHPKGEKAHETLVTIEAKPSDVHKALESLGLKAGRIADVQNEKPAEGPDVGVLLEWTKEDGTVKRVPVSQLLIAIATGKPLGKNMKFRFTGSEMVKLDPNKPDETYGADKTGTLITIFPVTGRTVFQSFMTMKEEKYVKLETDKKQLPKEGTPVKLILEVGK
jgi:hypothetical protein